MTSFQWPDSQLVFASGNAGKLREVTAILAPLGIQVVAQAEFGVGDVEETGVTFVENALIKARHASAKTGLPALADDSGLCVAALGGAPGVRSARYAGEGASDADNVSKLLDALRSISERRAWFHCAIVFLRAANDPAPLISQARWLGKIGVELAGTGGFGYDPVFEPDDAQVSAAQLPADEKNRVSHRARALAGLVAEFEASRG